MNVKKMNVRKMNSINFELKTHSQKYNLHVKQLLRTVEK